MSKEWGQCDNKGKLDSFLTMLSQTKENPGFPFVLGPWVLMLDYLKLPVFDSKISVYASI